MDADNQQQMADTEQQARRRLLKLAAYTPPAILGVMTVGIPAAEAVTVTYRGFTFDVSATSNACNPCQRIINGNYSNRDLRNCLQSQCTTMCLNCDIYVATGTTCNRCETVLNAGCTAPAACGGCNCRQRKNGQWRC